MFQRRGYVEEFLLGQYGLEVVRVRGGSGGVIVMVIIEGGGDRGHDLGHMIRALRDLSSA